MSNSPIVRSGKSALMFEWQGNQLATSRLDDDDDGNMKNNGLDTGWSDVVLDAVAGFLFFFLRVKV